MASLESVQSTNIAAEIEALLALARTPIEKHAVRKLIALTSAS
jgi:hypothetical protein